MGTRVNEKHKPYEPIRMFKLQYQFSIIIIMMMMIIIIIITTYLS